MDSQALWIVALSIATPVAGVVGFAIQIREVKKARLENEKLQLEIAELKKKAEKAERRIIPPTGDEVLKFGVKSEVLFSKVPVGESVGEGVPTPSRRVSFKDLAVMAAIAFGVVLFVGYLLYDLYRLIEWVVFKF